MILAEIRPEPLTSRMTTLSGGSSSVATEMWRAYQEPFTELLQVQALRPPVFAELEEAYTESVIEDDSTPVDSSTYNYALQFLQALPYGLGYPEVGNHPDGHIFFEWYSRPDRLLDLSIDSEGKLYWAFRFGTERQSGSVPFFGNIPHQILRMAKLVVDHDEPTDFRR